MRKKRYWVMNAQTGKDYICDATSKKQVAERLGVKKEMLRVERFHYLPEQGKTMYDIPMEGY